VTLRVLLDGKPLGESEGKALWTRFSAWMETHQGDLAGFARQEGFTSVHPELHDGEPVLVASHTAPQRPYANAPTRRGAAGGAGHGGGTRGGATNGAPGGASNKPPSRRPR
jgi:hypothetical protein